MRFKLVDPQNGSKVVIEGPYAKSGKTWLASAIATRALDQNPNLIGFGNMALFHDQYTQVKRITKQMLDIDEPKIILLDELDTKWTYQKHWFSEGLLTFWGYGASHYDCAVIATIQYEYQMLRNKLLRKYHIFIKYPLISQKTGLPYGVRVEFQMPFYRGVKFTNGKAYNYYDYKDKSVSWIDFSDFTAKIVEKEEEDNGKNTKSKLYCEKCGWEWTPKTDHPLQCPRCNKKFGYRVVG